MRNNCESPRDNSRRHKSHKRKVCKATCFKADVLVEKTLLSVCRVPLASIVQAIIENDQQLPNFIPYAQVLMTYEITLINNSNKEISNLNIFDTLAGIVFNAGGNISAPFSSSVEVTKTPSHITAFSPTEIATRNGALVDPCASSLPPCSVSKILVQLTLGAPPNQLCEIRQVQNTITVEGNVCGHGRMQPIVEKSEIWKTESDIMLVVGVNFNL